MPGPAEQARLVATLGATLRSMRRDRGMGTRRLADRSMVARWSIVRLENGWRRPRPVTLAALAYGLDPVDPEPLREALEKAAGTSLRPDTKAGVRRRRRRELRGFRGGR